MRIRTLLLGLNIGLAAIAVQLAWTAAFVVIGRWVMDGAMNRLQVQGG